MKQWQSEKLHALIDVASFLNQQCWVVGGIAAALILAGVFSESVGATWAGGILMSAAVLMVVIVEVILRYVRWRKKVWK